MDSMTANMSTNTTEVVLVLNSLLKTPQKHNQSTAIFAASQLQQVASCNFARGGFGGL